MSQLSDRPSGGSGFETMITVNSVGPYFAVAAEDASGRVLARSATVRLER